MQYYLTSNPFTLVVDCAPLQWLGRMKDHNPRILRWYLSLLPFSFTIRHRPGRLHVNADYMSRVHEDPPEHNTLRGGVCPGARPAPPDSSPPAATARQQADSGGTPTQQGRRPWMPSAHGEKPQRCLPAEKPSPTRLLTGRGRKASGFPAWAAEASGSDGGTTGEGKNPWNREAWRAAVHP